MSNLGMAMGDSTRVAIETLLLEHPDVVAASLISEEAADGRSYPVAYVVPHPERMREARTRIYQADRESRVSQWRKAFDQAYRPRVDNPVPSFVGWTSCYTNKPLPDTEMHEWLECTTGHILSLHPRQVLEIGCGVGLLVQALAPRCESYRGTDLSPVAIASLRDFVASKPELRHVALVEREAVDLHDQPPHSVDTVIINSVIQYFPDLNYLRSVIGEAARVVRSGGRIFIGDVRDFGLLSLFHSAVQLAKAPSDASAGWLKRRISLAIQQERELAIDPQFFLALPDSDPRIHSVEVLLKRGKTHNELTRYRYDVVLQVGEAEPPGPRPDVEWQAGDHSIAEITAQLDARQFTSAIIRNVPNQRLASDIAGMRQTWSADDRQPVRTIRESLTADADVGTDPEDYWVLSDKGLCDVRISWPPHSTDGRFDVTLVALDRARSASSRPRDANLASAAPQCLATDPLEAVYRQQLGLELQQILRDRLPEASVPAAVFAVDTLPPSEPTVPPALAAHLSDGGPAVSRYVVPGAL
jgi:SAM-dependent methyltransferase